MTRTNDTAAHRRPWDFGLTIATVVLLGGLGAQSFIGTLYSWWATRQIPLWTQNGYYGFVDTMNAIAAPQVLALVVVMGLCVPKRLFSRTALVAVSAGMVIAGVVVWAFTGSTAQGLTVYLTLAALIQVAVVVMTMAGARGPSYLTQGRMTKIGSGLLHLGFVIFAIVVVALQRSPFMEPVFWTSAVLTTVGTIMAFYADKFAVRRVRPVTPED
ncbi:MAG: hypothetical protein PF636_04685 [Actinomycetota bacterium]|nr:hypothetical protein [Actinomycetota bacterium]